jgi:hypothetical protein
MFKNRALMSAAAGVLLFAAVAVKAQDMAITIALNAKVGDVHSYKMVVLANVAGNEATVTRKVKETVKEVKPTGEISVVQSDEGTTIEVGGMQLPEQPPVPPVTFVRNKVNRLLDIKDAPVEGIMTPEIMRLSSFLNEFLLPEKAVKSGDTWETVFDNPAVKDKKVTVKGSFLGKEKVEGTELLKVKQTAEAQTDAAGAKMTVDMTGWLDPANGATIRVEGTVKDLPTTQFGPVTWQVKVTPLKDEPKK